MTNKLCWAMTVSSLVFLAACGSDDLPGNNPPSIGSFDVSENSGAAPLDVAFSWNISDPDGDALTCVLDFGDDSETATVENCTSSSTQPHTYTSEDTYTATLTVSDGEGDDSSDVQITVGDPPPPPPPSTNCDEPNNSTPETACPLELGDTQSALVEADGDIDFYRFSTDETGVATVSIASLPDGVSFTVDIFDAQRNKIAERRFLSNNPVNFPILSEESTFFVRMEGNRASSDPYEISVTFDDSDAYELNNTPEDAKEIPLNQTIQADIYGIVYTTDNSDPLDKDFFFYETSEPGVTRILLSSVPNVSVLRMRILDENNQPIRNYIPVSSNNTGEFLIISEPGKFFVEIVSSSATGTTESYDLRTDFTLDANEPNNNPESATQISGDTVEGAIYGFDLGNNLDTDYYTFTASQAGKITLSSVPTGSLMKIKVTTASAQPVCESPFISAGQIGECDFSGGDTYIVQVTSTESNPERYTINVTTN